MITKRRLIQMAGLIALLVATNLNAKAQDGSPLRMGVGLNVGSTLKDPAMFTAGGDLRLQKGLGNSLSGILTTGYYQFFKAKKNTEGFGIVPLKAGLKYFPAKNVYIAAEAGVGFGTKKNQQTSFVYSPSVGLAFGDGFDVSLKYENYTKYQGYAQELALRLAYGFKL